MTKKEFKKSIKKLERQLGITLKMPIIPTLDNYTKLLNTIKSNALAALSTEALANKSCKEHINYINKTFNSILTLNKYICKDMNKKEKKVFFKAVYKIIEKNL